MADPASNSPAALRRVGGEAGVNFGPIPKISSAAAATGGPRRHAKVQAKLAEIEAFLPQIKAELERVSAPGAGLAPALSTLVQTQLQAAIGIFKSDEIATEAQIAEVKKSEIGAVRVAKAVSQLLSPKSSSCSAFLYDL